MGKLVHFSVLLFVALLGTSVVAGKRVSYDGYKVLRADSVSRANFDILANLQSQDKYDFWSGPHLGRTADIMVSPEERETLESFLRANDISFSPIISDLGFLTSAVAEETVLMAASPQAASGYNWTAYHSLETMNNWLAEVESANPNLVTLINIGKSSEGRNLTVVKISRVGNSTNKKPAIWIDGTIHAREWISTTTATYAINELVSGSTNKAAGLLNATDFYFMPVVNPDGYEYSRNTDRLWRKSRSVLANSTCRGVDVNRNFGFKWENANQSGSNECSITYPGPAPFSEPEAAAIRDFILNNSATINFQAFITLHSYAQLWMTPWGYTTDLPANYNELMRVANKATQALTAVYGTTYKTGSAANILYKSTGTSRDWAKGAPNITYVYTIELRDTGRYGFVLPPSQITPTGKETWAGIVVAVGEIANATQT